ncbi:MAG TPA: SDR family NAD(P)-dependent oxidoreductase [Pirellulaceae bacterium]|nr:SDR family NAD(P)-dependent oxidoreductase [Pirellulaceae bacterium]
MDLNGKVALVTGGTMGIGAAIAVDLARRGADVAIAARNLGGPAEQTRELILASGRRCLLIGADCAVAGDCSRAVAETVKQLSRLDVLVHNAGGPAPGRIEDVTPELWRHTMDLHVNANFYLERISKPS